MHARHPIFAAVILILLLSLGSQAHAQKGPETTLTQLPQDHEYQKVLRNYMAMLKEADFAHGIHEPIPLDKNTNTDPEYLYRQYILTLMYQPLVGTKRGTPAVNAPPGLFVLSAIETSKAVMVPCVWPETLTAFIHWDYAGNHYRNSRALKLRAFVGAVVQIVMFHNFAEHNDSKSPPPIRPDWHGYNAVIWAAAYPDFKDVLPAEVQKAYEDGLKQIGLRMLSWGVRGESCESDLMTPLGMVYISRAIHDPEFTKAVEDRVRMICTEPRHFNKAGYWLERGGIDTGFGGAANLYAVWIALLTDWPFAKEAVEKTYRLRGHLVLPEPDGRLTGPSHFNARLGSPAIIDQFDCRKSSDMDSARDVAASMVTDEAAQFVFTPTPEKLQAAPGRCAYERNEDIGQNPRDSSGRYINNDEIVLYPWKLRMWWTYNFPISINPAYSHYKKGAFAHRQELEAKNSPMLKSPYLRGENFIRDFDKEFVATRQPGFAAILQTGQIGAQKPDDNKAQFPGPLGLGGGQLSAFWTPTTGSVILGLRSGMSYGESFDKLENWRNWPNNSVSGITAGGVTFSSARIVKPEVATEIKGNAATVKVSGAVPAFKIVIPVPPESADVVKQAKKGGGLPQQSFYDGELGGKLDYARTFKIDDKGVSVETTITADGKESIAELYEVLPIYLRDPEKQPKATPTSIEFQVDGKFVPASDQYVKAQAIKLSRFGGTVLVKFDSARRVKLSPAEWADNWFTKATARNVLIDLLENGDKPANMKGEKKVSYRIETAVK